MLALWVGLAVLLLDQCTKWWIREAFYFGESRPVIEGFFYLVYVRNPGAAWGLLGGQNLVLILFSLTMIALMIIYRKTFLYESRLHKVMYGLMLGGVIGNLIDRIRFAWVTDFLDFHFGSYQYPSFNVADSAICIAVMIYFIVSFRQEYALKKGNTEKQRNE